jgi:hypothetical protein
MSTSLLYHAFGLRGHRYRRTCYEDGHVSFKVELKAEQLCCSACHCRNVVRRGRVERRFRSLPIGSKPVWIVVAVQRVTGGPIETASYIAYLRNKYGAIYAL